MPFQPTHCSRWDYGYALLKEAGIYDSAGKPVKQREVIIFFIVSFFIGSDLVSLSLGRYGTCSAWCGRPRPESWSEVHGQGGAGCKEGAFFFSCFAFREGGSWLLTWDFFKWVPNLQDNPFGSLPKFLGIKLSENYTAADSRAQGAFQVWKINGSLIHRLTG